MPDFYNWQGENLVLSVKAQPNASKNEFSDIMGAFIKLRITAPPVDGKANQQLIRFLASTFGVSKSSIQLLNGDSCREKRFLIKCPASLPDFIQAGDTD